MATREILISDLSGMEGAATVWIGYDGVAYELDLTVDEHAGLESALRPYLAVARPAQPGQRAPRRLVPETTAEERAAIRSWGKSRGLEFAQRGRIPRRVIDAYDAAHGIDREWPEG